MSGRDAAKIEVFFVALYLGEFHFIFTQLSKVETFNIASINFQHFSGFSD